MGAKITIVGLGSGDEQQLTLGVWRVLQSASLIYLRTEKHPVVQFLVSEGITFKTFDHLYEANSTFEGTYEAIVETLLSEAEAGADQTMIVYAVPGHPMVAEATVRQLLTRGQSKGITIELLGGESFLDQTFVKLGFDPIEGFLMVDAADLKPEAIHPNTHTLIAQVYDRQIASDVKLALMDIYPDDYIVIAAHALGVKNEERVERLPLFELDRTEAFGNLSLIWVPRSDDIVLQNHKFARLHEIIRTLRSPEGCPWDREQTHTSLRKNFIEETYEVLETIDDDDPVAMCEELGDVLLQIMLHAQIEEEEGTFTIRDVISGLNEKLIRRHPHVFGSREADNAEEALQTWQEMKVEEKRNKGIEVKALSQLSGIPRDLPAIMTAYKLQKKAAEVGFDWNRIEDVLAKVEEEINEIKQLVSTDEMIDMSERREARKGEIGDLLFAAVNAARFWKIDPEEALVSTNRKFIRRFGYIEEQLRLAGRAFHETDLAEMEQWWQAAKTHV
jgi:tetrapyrrole methylase family protein/MazG family protein